MISTDEAVALSTRKDKPYLGISESLMYSLVDLYFICAYNANLLLHKGRFLEALRAGTVEAHLILSVCAYAANFYRDQDGNATLRDHGFMTEWAKRAGSLVFQDAEALNEDNIATFCILGTFWYSQGHWRLSYLHKANACNLLQIVGSSSFKLQAHNTHESEMQRRRFWACYLMSCALMEGTALFDPIVDASALVLPCPEEAFEYGPLESPVSTLDDDTSGTSIYAGLIRGFKLWQVHQPLPNRVADRCRCTISTLVKDPEASVGDRFSKIYALDDAAETWWSMVHEEYKLSPEHLAYVAPQDLPNILLLNAVYHQAICALHASMVPLFSWTPVSTKWASARQASAQKTYEHACALSELIAGVRSTQHKVQMTHSFLAYSAYSGCAVQIPFMWSSNDSIKKRAVTNVGQNMRLIQSMAQHWKFASLVQKQLGCLYSIHMRRSVDLENEPRYLDIRKLVDFKVCGTDARLSILGFTEILRSKDNGYAKSGEENNNLGIIEEDNQVEHSPITALMHHERGHEATTEHTAHPYMDVEDRPADITGTLRQNDSEAFQSPHFAAQNQRVRMGSGAAEVQFDDQSYVIWPPFFHPTMLGVPSESDMLNVPLFDPAFPDLAFGEPDSWFANFGQ